MLKKILLLLPLAGLLATGARAQLRYTFKDTTTAYVNLPANATPVNGTDMWYGNDYTLPMPFSWTIDSTSVQPDFKLSLDFFGVLTDLAGSGSVTGFTAAGAEFMDRGNVDTMGISRSSIRYLTTGTAPNRIFKVEIRNAGFAAERSQYLTMDDSVNVQMWVYEGSSTFELHYGPSKITYFNDYFDIGFGSSLVLVALLQDLDFSSAVPSGTFYYLNGLAASPALSTAVIPTFPTGGLATWPASGKVYRFTPKKKTNVGVGTLATLGNVKVYPNPASNMVIVEGTSAGTKATLYSMLGQPVLQTILGGQQSLDIASLPAGLYKLVLTNKEGVNGATTIVKE